MNVMHGDGWILALSTAQCVDAVRRQLQRDRVRPSIDPVSFVVPPDAYARFMGRYAEPLAEVFAAFAGVGEGDRVPDVGCGPGALTAHLRSVRAKSRRSILLHRSSTRFA